MSHASIVVVPSRVCENQSTTILEALTLGARVVATSVGGNAETLRGAGILVMDGSVSDLHTAMVTLISTPKGLPPNLDRYLPDVVR